jgi:predicted metal-dependent hydrolase
MYAGRIGVKPSAVSVLDLGYRWGSCSSNGKLNFHWRTVCLPSRIIEYVAVHELVHLHEANHGEAFWQRVRRAMPDYEERGKWLAEEGSGY